MLRTLTKSWSRTVVLLGSRFTSRACGSTLIHSTAIGYLEPHDGNALANACFTTCKRISGGIWEAHFGLSLDHKETNCKNIFSYLHCDQKYEKQFSTKFFEKLFS